MFPKGLLKEYSRTLSMMMRIIDIAIVLFAAWIAFILRFNQLAMPHSYLMALAISTAVTSITFSSFNLYTSVRGDHFLRHIFIMMQAVCVMAFVLAGMAFFTKSGHVFSRIWFTTWMIFAFLLLIGSRYSLLLLLRFMRSHGLNERRVVIFGAGELGIKLAGTIAEVLWTGFKIVNFIDDHACHKKKMIDEIPVVQTPKDLSAYLSMNEIDEIWLALPLRAEARVKKILYELRHHTINTRFVLDIFGLDLLNHSVTEVAGFPVLNIRSTPMVGMNRFIKALEDRLLALFILIVISPLLLVIAFAVKLTSKGPVFFKQLRLGWDGRVIKVYKFRTMYLHHEEGQITQATFNDKRVTPFGRWLRRTSLDELPQFINVLQGRMSIVGPRPHALAHNEIYKNAIHTYMQRHRVKPGITGWAQVNGWRGETDTLTKMRKRVEYDLYYINNWSLAFDIKIILLTFFHGFIGRNAY